MIIFFPSSLSLSPSSSLSSLLVVILTVLVSWLTVSISVDMISLSMVEAREEYVSMIPNGNNVRDENGDLWLAVGHQTRDGGEKRNQFGKDFQKEGYEWTRALCMMDSDSDGVANGVELGDPDCEWSIGKTPKYTTYITHPGIAEIYRPPKVNTCSNVTIPSFAKTANVVFPNYKIPDTSTSVYARMGFRLDTILSPNAASDMWLLKFFPIIQNVDFVNNILLYSCTELQVKKGTNIDYSLLPSTEGSMPCSSLLYSWSAGADPFCMPDLNALKVKKDQPWVMMEINYKNPDKRSNIIDSSGIAITFVENADVQSNSFSIKELAYIWVGAAANTVSIPASQDYWEIEALIRLNDNAQYIPDSGLTVYAYSHHGGKYSKKHWTTIDSPKQSSTFQMACNPRYSSDMQQLIPIARPFKLYKQDIIAAHCSYSNPRPYALVGGEGVDDEKCIHYLLAEAPGVYINTLSQASDVRGGPSPLVSETGKTTVCGAKYVGPTGAPAWMWTHGALMTIAWAILIPIGTLFPIFFKKSTKVKWFKWHQGMQFAGSSLAILAGLISLASVSSHGASRHAVAGLAVFILLPIHLIISAIRPHPPSNEEEEKTPKRRIWELVHAVLARILLILAGVAISLGLSIFGLYTGEEREANGFGSFFLFTNTVIAIATGIYSLYYRYKNKNAKSDRPVEQAGGIGDNDPHPTTIVEL